VNEKQKERWGRVRAKGRARYILSNIIASVLCVMIGHALWWLTEYVWRGESTPPFIREPGTLLALAVGFAIAGYLQSSRGWRRNEREYAALSEADESGSLVTRTGAI
jgi:hypothetical protein